MIKTTAPGKIILFGEHAVVYKQPAIAVPVADVAAQAVLRPTPAGTGCRIVASDLKRDDILFQPQADDPIATAIHVTLLHLNISVWPDAEVHISSTIPLGRGLGSGAAVSAAIVRGIAQLYQQTLSPAEVSELVYHVEQLYHGTPSGIDNTVIAYNQPVYFVREQPLERLQVARPLTFVIADTGIVAETHKVVGDLRQRWQARPQDYEPYFAEIGGIVHGARTIIEDRVEDKALRLGDLMNQNQTLLEALDVSSPELDHLIKVARACGAWGAKLSGAGRGGNMIALVAAEQAQSVARRLLQAGAVGVIVTTVLNQQ